MHRYLGLFGAVAALVAGGAAMATPAAAHLTPRIVSPQVIHTGTAPTGYEVTFRFSAPDAASVRIRGEWFFSSPATTTTTTSDGRLPSQWRPGDFPIAYPNQGPAANWPVADMTRDPSTGVWSYTTPLPSGTFTYGFYVNFTASAPTLTGSTELSDPGNPPWNTSGSVEPTSQVYVPSDPRFGTVDLSWQAPRRTQGKLVDVSYPDPQSTNPVGSHPLAIYLPPGYDPHRRAPYPTLYLSHGSGGNEVDWSTQGAAGNILDNLIAAGRVQPTVVVMTDFNNLGECASSDPSCYALDVTHYVIPFVEAHFNVSPDGSDRAFGGLSAGGRRASYLLFNDTTTFGYYGIWSSSQGTPDTGSPLWQNPDLKTRLGLRLGGGLQDQNWIPGAYTYEQNLTAAGIPYTVDPMDGGHEWYTWRQMLYDFLGTVAFRHTTTTVTVRGTAGAGARDVGYHRAGHPLRDRAVLRRRQPRRPTGAACPRCGAHRAAAGRHARGNRRVQRRRPLQLQHQLTAREGRTTCCPRAGAS
jgi:enterochelin esterase-like enzyme